MLIVSIIWGGLNTLVYWSDPYQCRMERLWEEAGAIEAVTIGYSLNAAIDFDALGMNGYHLWRPGGDIYEAEAILNHVIAKTPNLKVVFMAMSYAVPYNSDHSYVKRSRVYNEIPWMLPLAGDWENYIKAKIFRLNKAKPDFYKNIGINFQIATGAKDCITYYNMPEVFNVDDKFSSYPKDEVRRKCTQVDSIFTLGMAATFQHHPDAIEMAQQQLIKLVKISEQHGIKLVLFSPPLSEPFAKRYLSREHIANLNRVMDYVVKQAPGNYYDFSNDSLFSQNLSFFADPVHINREGARAFSLLLKEKINPE